MDAIKRALREKGTSQGPPPPSPGRRTQTHSIPKHHLPSGAASGDVDINMLDQAAFARVIQQQTTDPSIHSIPSAGPVDDEDVEMGQVASEDDDGVDFAHDPELLADPVYNLKITSLPILEVVSTQLLHLLSDHQHHEVLQIVTASHPPLSGVYTALTQVFDIVKKNIYQGPGGQDAFLDADMLGLKDLEMRKIIRKTNLATFLSSVFGSVEVGFFHLNEGFLATFCPDGSRLLKGQAGLFLDLKTQAYISAMAQPTRDQNSILNDLFPPTPQLTALFTGRRVSTTSTTGSSAPSTNETDLTPAELDFIKKCERRRDHLLSLGDGTKASEELREKYGWEGFLRELRGYVSRNWEQIVDSKGGKPRRPISKKQLAAKAAQIAQQSVGIAPDLSETVFAIGPPVMHHPQGEGEGIRDLYEKARMAANLPPTGGIPPPNTPGGKIEGSQHLAGTPGGSQIRRPWSEEEQQALFDGLDRVQGPNWAAILQLHGPGGTISEALKDRSQVQLKDKARNLKLFFLKGGFPVPAVLERVTGRLKGENEDEDAGEGKSRGRKRRRTTLHESGLPRDAQMQGIDQQGHNHHHEVDLQSQQQQLQAAFGMGDGLVGNVDPAMQSMHPGSGR